MVLEYQVIYHLQWTYEINNWRGECLQWLYWCLLEQSEFFSLVEVC